MVEKGDVVGEFVSLLEILGGEEHLPGVTVTGVHLDTAICSVQDGARLGDRIGGEVFPDLSQQISVLAPCG
ncbi:hypothetical protein GCM10027421_32070 [Microbacterium shaanxiense]